MDEKLIPKTTFWPYDVSGYLLPVLALVAGAVVANEEVLFDAHEPRAIGFR